MSRRAPVFGVVLFSQLIGLLIAFAIAVWRAEAIPTGQDLVLCLVAGVLGGVGVTALYRALAVGRMGIVAPVTGVLAAVIPVVAGIAFQGLPGPMVLAGIGLAVAAVLLVSRVADEGGGRAGLTEALVAGIAIGLFGVTIAGLGKGNVFAALAVIRSVQAVLIIAAIVATRATWRPERRVLPAIAVIGVLDMAGNGLYLLAVQSGALAVASVLSALYPVVTVILAAVLLRERITRHHTVGIGMAAVAIALIGFGSA